MRNFPYTQFPSGWFQVAWDGELQPGEVKPLRYFNTDLVLGRTESGRYVVTDAYCPHMGAHLGHGGKIEGENIRCPFHGWCYDTKDGSIANIPYLGDQPTPRVKLRTWEVREAMRMVLVWYDAEGLAPSWEPPAWPEATADDFYYGPEVRRDFPAIAIQPQLVIENVVDPAHQQYIHAAAEPSAIIEHEITDQCFRVKQKMTFGARGRKTFLTDEPIVAHLHIEAWGVGIGLVRFMGLDGSIIIHTSTPIDNDKSDMRSAILPKRAASDFVDGKFSEKAQKRVQHQMRQVEKDIVIWENMSYVANPPYVGVEIPAYPDFKRWTWQFYPEIRNGKQGARKANAANTKGAA